MEAYLQRIVEVSLGDAPETMLKASLEVCLEILRADTGSILGEEGPFLRFLFSDNSDLIGVNVPLTSLAGAALTGNKVIYTYAPMDKRHYDGVDKRTRKATNYLLTIPIPSIHQRAGTTARAKNAGALQALFNEDAFPELGLKEGSLEFDLNDFKSGPLCGTRVRQVFWILPMIVFSMEVMRLRQTSYQAIHELKNKMISGLSWLGNLKEDLTATGQEWRQDPNLSEDFELTESSIREGAELAKNYLQLTKLYEPNFAAANVNDILRETASSAEVLAVNLGVKDFSVERAFDPNIGERQLDVGKLKMAFFNLCKNAVEVLVERGVEAPRVTLRSELTPDGGLLVTVADNGPGMPKEIADQLFIPFKTKKEGGTGLGLTIVKKIVDLHGGNIQVETGPTGTRFAIRV